MCFARADPYVGFTYPAGIQAGTTVRVLVGGQGFREEVRGWVSGDGVKVVDIERVPGFTRAAGEGQRQWLGKWLRNLEDGVTAMPELPKDEVLRNWPRNRWWENLTELDPLALSIVRRDHYLPRPDPLQAAPAIADRLILTIAAELTAAPGLRHLVLHDNVGASAQHPFFVTAEPHVAEPLYEAPPPKGKKRSVRETIVCRTPVVLDGQILPGETDVFRLMLNGGERLTCLLTGRELMPYLGDTVPGFFNPVLRLTDEEGCELAFADDDRFLPDPVLTCDIKKTGIYRLEVRDNLYRGRDDFVYAVSCFTDARPLPTPQERAFVCAPRPAARGTWTGRIPQPGGSAAFDFEVEEPGRMDFELFARRIGSPLDGVLRLYGPLKGLFAKDGPLLATWDDVTNRLYVGSVPQAECDPAGSWEMREPGDYRLTVEDRVGGGGDDFSFMLDVRPTAPDFEVYAVKSALVFRPWKDSKARLKVKVVRRGGFDGAIAISGDGDFNVERGTVPAGADEAEIVVAPMRRDWSGVRRISLTAVGETASGLTLKRPVTPGSEVEQAFAYTHVLPTKEFLAFMRPVREGTEEPPAWIDMPYDRFLPRRVIHLHADLSAFRTVTAAAFDALAEAAVVLTKAPDNCDDDVLEVKFASSAAHVRRRSCNTFAVETTPAGDAAAARAVLSGCVGFVTPKTLAYAEGDARRVRTLARALKLPHDNDMLLYVPQTAKSPLAGPCGAAARRLLDAGFSFDFVTDKTLTNAPFGGIYRALYVPQRESALPAGTRTFLKETAAKRGCRVVFAESLAKDEIRKLADKTRRELLPKGVRFARFGRAGGEGWYFVHNPTSSRITGEVRFRIRGWAKSAYAMDVRTGSVQPLKKTKSDKFVLTLEAGASAWIWAN